ncbi:MAG: hypothetical protein FJ291_32500 [Planctomycetes bacterium]|nr:hypothetical protein [Planctomycetota bacterium]
MDELRDDTPDEPQLQGGKPLRDDLAALYSAPQAVPPAVDAAVLARARRHLAPRLLARVAPRWAAAAVAAITAAVAAIAAAVLLFVVLLGPMRDAPEPIAKLTPHSAAKVLATFEKADINRDGQVDILDAFALARQLDAKLPRKEEWDITGDGSVDRRDVDAIAIAAVKLERGTLH